MHRCRFRPKGFSLIEVMVVVAILGILATVGVPSFVTMIKNNRLAAQSADLTGALYFARSEAIKRNDTVSVVSKGSGGSWAEGWDVVFDHDGADEEILRVFEPLTGGNTLTCSSDCSDITFSGAGTLTSPAAGRDFILCDDRNEGRKIDVRITGSIRTSSDDHGCGS